jgi:hypothetical protein
LNGAEGFAKSNRVSDEHKIFQHATGDSKR